MYKIKHFLNHKIIGFRVISYIITIILFILALILKHYSIPLIEIVSIVCVCFVLFCIFLTITCVIDSFID